MRRQLADVLTSYLSGWRNVRDCAEWLSAIDWGTDLDPGTRALVGRMELLATEVLEGLRSEAEFWQEAADLVFDESGLLWIQPLSMTELQIASSSNDRTTPMTELTVGPELAIVESPS